MKRSYLINNYFYLNFLFYYQNIATKYVICIDQMAQRAVNLKWLRDTSEEIKAGKITMKEAADKVLYDTVDGFQETHKISTKQLYRYLDKFNMKVFEVGRRNFKKSIEEEFEEEVKYSIKEDNVGITKTWMILNKKDIKCSRYSVEMVFKKLRKTKEKKKRIEKVRCRYLVEMVNGVWHGDIHYIIRPYLVRYIFALIDDRSRFIVGYGIFTLKTASNVLNVFKKTIETNGVKPLAYWCDNGAENKAKTVNKFLSENEIYQIFTIPGNPQSNGKIERFWRGLDKRIKDLTTIGQIENAIERYVDRYNFHIPHFGLEKDDQGFNKTPVEVYIDESLQATDIFSTKIIIDNTQSLSLAEFMRIQNAVTSVEPDPSNIYTLLN